MANDKPTLTELILKNGDKNSREITALALESGIKTTPRSVRTLWLQLRKKRRASPMPKVPESPRHSKLGSNRALASKHLLTHFEFSNRQIQELISARYDARAVPIWAIRNERARMERQGIIPIIERWWRRTPFEPTQEDWRKYVELAVNLEGMFHAVQKRWQLTDATMSDFEFFALPEVLKAIHEFDPKKGVATLNNYIYRRLKDHVIMKFFRAAAVNRTGLPFWKVDLGVTLRKRAAELQAAQGLNTRRAVELAAWEVINKRNAQHVNHLSPEDAIAIAMQLSPPNEVSLSRFREEKQLFDAVAGRKRKNLHRR